MWDSIVQFFKTTFVDQVAGDPVWKSVALIGQIVFGGRFVLQWIASEIRKKSHVPTAFWYISLVGSMILLSYSIHIKDPIFVLGFSLNTVIYVRNLHLIHLHARKGVAAAAQEAQN